MTTALALLVRISHEQGNPDEEETYRALLSEYAESSPVEIGGRPSNSMYLGFSTGMSFARVVFAAVKASKSEMDTEKSEIGRLIPKVPAAGEASTKYASASDTAVDVDHFAGDWLLLH